MERIESQAEAHAHDSRLSRRSAAVQAAFFLPYLRPGMRVLDVGCGPGTITLGLAEAVAPGEVVGVDIVEDRLHLARAAAEERALANVRFEPGDIHRLPFGEGEFDAALAHGVLEHLPDPLAALGEMRRVLRPGAVVGVRSPEHTLAVVGPAAPWIQEWLTYFLRVGEADGESPQIGRSLRAIVRAAGFGRAVGTASVETYGTPDESRACAEDLVRLLAAGRFGDPARAEVGAFIEAFRKWGEHPDAFWASTWCEVVGWVD
jgi:SAM-dependent methyltransferase